MENRIARISERTLGRMRRREKVAEAFDSSLCLFNSEGKMLLAAPHQETIARLRGKDPRIEYQNFILPQLWKNHLDNKGRIKDVTHIGEYEYNQLVSLPVASYAMSLFPNNEFISARGIACSINGRINENELTVRDISEIVNLGDERARDITLVASVYKERGKPELHHRINQYLVRGHFSISMDLSDNNSRSVFPALLLYDESMLTPAHINMYSVKLPPTLEEKSKAIIKAIVLPKVVN